MENINNVNIDEIPFLNCKMKENSKILIKLFNEIKSIKNKNLTYKDFKGDIDKMSNLMNIICTKKKKEISAISYFENRQYCHIYDKNNKKKEILTTIVSKTLSELLLKICVYCYYK